MPDGYTGSVEAYSPDLVDALRQLRVPDAALEPMIQNGFAVLDGDEAADDELTEGDSGKDKPKPRFDLGKFRCHETRECLYQRVVKTDAKGKSRVHYSQVRHPAGMPRLLRVLRPKGLPFASRRSVEETRYLIEWVGLKYAPQWVKEGELDNGDAWAYFPGVEISSRTERTNYANVVKAQIRAFKITVERPPRHTGFVDDPEAGWRYYLPDGRWLGPNGTSGGTQQSDADGDIGIPDCDFPLGEIWREEFRVLPSAPPSSEDIAELGRFLVDVNQRGQISAQVGGAVRSLVASRERFASMVYVVGATGEGKTVGATFPLGVIGPRPPDFQTDTTFQATPTSIEGVIRPNRDRPILVDDLNNPTVNSLGERVRNYQTVERAARASYDGGEVFGRGQRDASRRQGTIIRGLITVTGETAEDLKESTCRRVILLQFGRGETDWVLLREGWRAYQPILTSLGHAVIRFVLDLLAKEGPRAVRDLINRLDREAYDYMLEGLQSARPKGNGVFIHSLAKCYSFLLSGAALGDLACRSENALIEAVRPHLVALAVENLDTVTGAGVGTPPAEFFHGAIYRALHTNAHLFSRRTDKPLSSDTPSVGDYGYRPVIRDGCVSYEPIGTTQLGWLEDDDKTLCLRTRELTAVCNEEARRQGLRVQFSEQTLPGLLVGLGVVVPGPDRAAQQLHVPAGGPKIRVLVISREDASEAGTAGTAGTASQNTSISAINAVPAYKNEAAAENRAGTAEPEKNTRISAAFDEPGGAVPATVPAVPAVPASDQMPYARHARAIHRVSEANVHGRGRAREPLADELMEWGKFCSYPLLQLRAGPGGRNLVRAGEDEWRLFGRIASAEELAAAVSAAKQVPTKTGLAAAPEGAGYAEVDRTSSAAPVETGPPASSAKALAPAPEGAGCAEADRAGSGAPAETGPPASSAEALAPASEGAGCAEADRAGSGAPAETGSPAGSAEALAAASEGAGCAEADRPGSDAPAETGPPASSTEALAAAPEGAGCAEADRAGSNAPDEMGPPASTKPVARVSSGSEPISWQRRVVIDSETLCFGSPNERLTVVPLPEQVRPGAEIGAIMALAIELQARQLWLHHSWTKAAKFPRELPPDATDRDGFVHAWASGELPPGCHLFKPDRLKFWMRAYRKGESGSIAIAVPALEGRTDWRKARNARELLETLLLLERLGGARYQSGPGSWYRMVIQRSRRKGAFDADLAPSDFPLPWRRQDEDGETFNIAPMLSWERPLLESERRHRYVWQLDNNKNYVAAANRLHLPLGVPVLQTIAFDPKLTGCWKARVIGEPAHAGLLPHPCYRRRPTGSPASFDEPAWYTTSQLASAHRLGCQILVEEAWIYPQSAPMLEQTYRVTRDAFYELDRLELAGDRSAIVAATVLKDGYVRGLSALDMVHERDGDEPIPLHRPDWAAEVRAAGGALILRQLHQAANFSGRTPFAISVDACCFVSNESDPFAAAAEIGLPLGRRLGVFKPDGFARLSDLIPILDEGDHHLPALSQAMREPKNRTAIRRALEQADIDARTRAAARRKS